MLLRILLSFILLLAFSPEVSVIGIHPASVLVILAYVAGIRLIWKAKARKMWTPKHTAFTVEDRVRYFESETLNKKSVSARFLILAAAVAVAGYMVAQTGIVIAEETRLSETIVGGLFTAVSTSLPELIVTFSAVREGALTLAVSNIVGGNTFDVLTVALVDFAYSEGSVYHAFTGGQTFIITLTLILSAILVMGLLDRERHGIGGIGWESFLILVLFVGGYFVLIFT